MSRETAHNVIRKRFEDSFASPQSCPTQYDNAPFTRPDDSKWARLAIQTAGDHIVEFGDVGRYRTPGTMDVQIFTPLDDGDQPALALLDILVPLFRGKFVTPVQFFQPSGPTRAGVRNGWWQTNLTCPFHFDS